MTVQKIQDVVNDVITVLGSSRRDVAHYNSVANEEFRPQYSPNLVKLAQRVFENPELLEQILDNLNLRHLLVALVTHRFIHRTITGSCSFNRKLNMEVKRDCSVYTPFETGVFLSFTYENTAAGLAAGSLELWRP